MPAKFVKSYAAPDGQIFPTLEQAQQHEIMCLVPDDIAPPKDAAEVAQFVMNNKVAILECLKQRERVNLRESKPKAKRGRPAKVETPETT